MLVQSLTLPGIQGCNEMEEIFFGKTPFRVNLQVNDIFARGIGLHHGRFPGSGAASPPKDGDKVTTCDHSISNAIAGHGAVTAIPFRRRQCSASGNERRTRCPQQGKYSIMHDL